jgi:hypothetical protein
MDDLRKLAFEEIAASAGRMGGSELAEEAFSDFTSRQVTHTKPIPRLLTFPVRYPELRILFVESLRPFLSSRAFQDTRPFRRLLSRYFTGELPHSREMLKSLLQTLMDDSTVVSPNYEPGDYGITIPRVSQPWPARTKVALRTSLDEGTFEDLHLSITPGPGETECQLHFARNADKGVATSIPICKLLNCLLSETIITTRLQYLSCILAPETTQRSPLKGPCHMHIHFLTPYMDQLAGLCILCVHRSHQL